MPRAFIVALLGGVAVGTQAWAEAATTTANAGAPTAGDSTVINEVIVTAQRRAERLEDVPVAITAIQGQTLARSGVQRIQDLGQLVVGAQVNRAGGFVQPAIRGVTTNTTGWGFENSVAIYIDGFYQSDTVSINGDFANLSSIQVLKGPQGTLYGRNAMAGAIVIDTLEPSDTWTGNAQVTYGRFNDVRAEGFVSGPIAKGVDFSVAGYYRRSDGYIRDYPNGLANSAGSFDATPLGSQSYRTKLKLSPFSNLTATLAYNYSFVRDARGLVYTIFRFPSPALPLPPLRATQPDTVTNNGLADDATWKHEVTATIHYQTPVGTISSYTGYSVANFRDAFDSDGSNAGIASYTIQPRDADYEKTFQEGLDYQVDPTPWMKLLIGGFYYHNYTLNSAQSYSGATGVADDSYGGAGGVLQQTSHTHLNANAYAAYADTTVNPIRRLFLTAGVRYNDENRFISYHTVRGASVAPLNPDLAGKQANFHGVTPRFNIRYELAPRTDVYASYSEGFKSGVFNPSPVSTPALVVPIKPETINSTEIGFKTATSVLRFDAAAYYYVYHNLQVGITIPDPSRPGTGAVVNLTSNANRAEAYGGEWQVTYSPLRDLNFRTGLAYVHARFTDFKNATAIGWNAATGLDVTGQIQDWDGQQMPRAPTWQANIGGDYTRDFAGGRLTFSTNGSFTTSYIVRDASLWGPLAGPALANKQRFRTGDFALMNAQINWTDPSGHYTVGVYCDNCTNTRYRITFGGSAFGDYQQFDPVGVGGRIGYKF